MLPELRRALIAVATEIGRSKRVGKIWVPTGEGGLQGYFEWAAVHYPEVFARLLGRLMVLQEKSRERAHRDG
jgi:hypothetical protein